MKTALLALFIAAVAILPGCTQRAVNSFEECAGAGYAIMESYPRQCSDGNRIFTENLTKISLAQAKEIAEKSACKANGNLKETHFYNPSTKTWWFDLDTQKDGCSPACVVSEETMTAETNWRCTGLKTD
jgi:hypothetical protein